MLGFPVPTGASRIHRRLQGLDRRTPVAVLDNPEQGEPGYETWKEKDPVFGGGLTWLTGSYDPETDTLYWPTGNPFPNSDDRDRPGDNLFTNCILA